MNEAPTEWTGHVWRQREYAAPGGRWGFAWEVLPPWSEDPVASGWRTTQEAAERAMNEALARYREKGR